MTTRVENSSTGPRTAAGKAIASKNALKHGLLSRAPVLPDENAQEFAAFRTALLDSLQPDGQVEALLADRAVLTAWRLHRAHRIEVGILAAKMHEEEEATALAKVH